MKKLSHLISAALVLSLAFTGCTKKMDPNDPASIRDWMEKQNVKFLPGTFINAALKGDTVNASLYLKAGIDVNGTDASGNNALAYAANKNNAVIVTYLLEHGAIMSLNSSKGVTPLVDAASLGNVDAVKAMIPYIQKTDPQLLGTTDALTMAARQGFVEVVKIFIEGGAPINNKSNEGWTALAWASKSGHVPVVEYLISKGADVNAGDKDGYTPLDWAKNEGYPKVIELLKKAGGKGKT